MKPILFNTPMVKALLNTKPGTWPVEPIDSGKPFKSQTRRVMKPQPEYNFLYDEPIDGEWFWTEFDTDDDMMGWWPSYDKWLSPRYQAGDKLWVREVWNKHPDIKDCCNPKHCTCCLHVEGDFIYKASFTMDEHGSLYYPCCGWESPIFMPRDAARLFLEVREVRVERLWGISEDDARREGVEPAGIFTDLDGHENVCVGQTAKEPFAELWNAVNGKGTWGSNPWVWVYSFMRVEG